ncbi:hypothetical protein LEMLEM_LOCUS22450 [Lemmus lemmus]
MASTWQPNFLGWSQMCLDCSSKGMCMCMQMPAKVRGVGSFWSWRDNRLQEADVGSKRRLTARAEPILNY